MYELKPTITKDLILKNLTEKEIFEHYLNIPVQCNQFFCSPLRKDEHPTCTFKYLGGKLFFRDWSQSRPKDCFNIVSELYGCNYYDALEIIYKDMLEGKQIKIPKKKLQPFNSQSKRKKKRIRVSLSKFSQKQINYLCSYGITGEQVKKFNVFAPERIWLDGKIIWTKYNHGDPCLAYYFGKDDEGNQRWKCYFYKRDNFRFIGNTNRINGWIQIPEKGSLLVITKSLKDVMVLDRLGIASIAMQNETTIPYDYIIEELKSRFDNLISFYDFDYTGVVNANKLRRLYDIPYVFLTDGRFNTKDYQAKDISDYVKYSGIDTASEFIECIKHKYL